MQHENDPHVKGRAAASRANRCIVGLAAMSGGSVAAPQLPDRRPTVEQNIVVERIKETVFAPTYGLVNVGFTNKA